MMKTLRFLTLLTLISLAYFPLSAQLDDGEIAQNWTLTDINGNTYTLYDLLDQGKTVVIDVSATWCGPCWNYHQTHALSDFYNEHGPDGSDQSMVFWIEGDLSTGMDDLYGLTDQSQGDWVTGTPFPIIDLDVNTFGLMDQYDINYFPTIYKICPNKQIYEVGQVGAPILETWIQSCTLEGELLSTQGTTCYGDGEGGADITASGGYSGINYDWSNGDDSQDLVDVEAGTYAVSISDGNGRTIVIDDIVLDGPLNPITLTEFAITDLSCHGDQSGGIEIEVEGGNEGFSYYWSSGHNDNIITNLSAGQYTVTVEDAEGCEFVEQFSVEQPDILDFSVEYTQDHCAQNGATITVEPVGGTEPYSLECSGGFVGQGSLEVVGLGEGDYTVDLIDANDCITSLDVSIENIEGPEIIMPAEPTVTCLSGPQQIEPFILNPGEGELEYYWTTTDGEIVDGQFDLLLTVGAPGTYELHIEDLDFGCDIQDLIIVNGNIDGPDIDAGPDFALDCNNQVGQPDFTLVDSGSDFAIQWSTNNGQILSGGNTADPQFGAAGTYTVEVTNNQTGCKSTDVVVVTDNSVHPDAQFGFTAEELTATFNALQSGATSYHWNFGDGQTSDAQNPQHTFAFNGTYHVCLTVTNTCGSEEHCLDIWVQNTTSAILVELAVGNISCFGLLDGSLEALAIGGSGNYTFSWLAPNGETLTGPALTNLGPGLYLLTVSDDIGNVTQVQVSIYEPTELVGQTQVIPPGGITGPAIDLSVDGGTQGYTYLWNNGATTQDLFNVPSGTYQAVVTDANGCQFTTEPVRIINPRDIAIGKPTEPVKVIGNPSLQPLIIRVETGATSATYAFRTFDALGRMVDSGEWNGNEYEVDFRNLADGVYVLSVYENDVLLETFRLPVWK